MKPFLNHQFVFQRAAVTFVSGLLLLCHAPVWAQPETGSITGKVQIVAAEPGAPTNLDRVVVFLDTHPDLLPHAADFVRPQIAQIDKAFSPSFVVISRGTSIDFPNRDPFSHNVFSRSRNARFDLERYAQGMSKSYTFEETGVNQIFCNIHPRMRALVMVLPNRHFARPDGTGQFKMPNVPPGEYTLVTWFERSGSQTRPVIVRPGSETSVELSVESRSIRRPTTRRRTAGRGVSRGLGVKREKLNLPVVRESSVAPPDGER